MNGSTLSASPSTATDEIVVTLSTQANLIPVYIAGGDEGFRRTLIFDFNHNGVTQVAPPTDAREGQALRPFSAQRWRELGVRYFIHLQGNQATVYSVSSGTATSYSISPSDNPTRDAHQLADAIFKGLFGKEGIASTRILYTVRTLNSEGKAISEVWCCDADGGSPRQLTREGEYCVTPCFLPPAEGHSAGSYFYVSYKLGQPKICAASLGGGKGKRFISLRGNQFHPAISPKRDQIAFISDAGGNPDLFLQSFSPETGPIGKPQQIFSAPRAAQASPTFNPSGNQLAFVSNKDGSPRIYLLDLPADRDSKARLLTKENRENTAPAWSPDGTKIAYSAMTQGTRQIWILELASGREWQLTQGPGHKENPCWAPDSLHLVFNSADRNSSELYRVNLNQPKAIKISRGPGEKRFPAWQR